MNSLAVQLLLIALQHANEIGTLIQTANAEGREITDAELDALSAGYDAKSAAVKAEIAKQRAGG